MSVLTILTILFILIIGTFAALILSYVIVPRNFRTYNNYSVRTPKVYKRRSRRR
jgi:uncharacterized protein involved in outer membrane biogenesis